MNMNETMAAIADPGTRSHVYRLLGEPFRYPTAVFFERLRGGAYAAELREALTDLAHVCLNETEGQPLDKKLSQALAGYPFEDYESLYITTFDVGAPQPPCPPNEGSYRDGVPRAKVLLQVAGFYEHFGLRMSTEEGKHELPDHLSAELEFMHFLAFKEAQARESGDDELVQGYVLAQRDFLTRHLTVWFPKFADKLNTPTGCPAFAIIAATAAVFFEQDLAFLRGCLKAWGIAEPREMPEIVELPPTDSAASGCCPAADE